MRGLGEFESDVFDCGHLLRRRGGTNAVRGRQRLEGSLGLGVLGRHHHGTNGEVLRPGKSALDGVGEQAPRRRAFHHGRRHAVDTLSSALRALGGGRFHARQTGVDALDGLIGFVHLNGNNQFEFVIGQGHRLAEPQHPGLHQRKPHQEDGPHRRVQQERRGRTDLQDRQVGTPASQSAAWKRAAFFTARRDY